MEFKLEVIARAKLSTNREIARQYGIHEKLVRDWRKKEQLIRENSLKGGAKRLPGAGRRPRNLIPNCDVIIKDENWQ